MLNFLTTTTVCGFSLYHVLAFFLIYSCTGWCLEVIFAAATTGQLVNRGFLNGPVCPIYGFGMIIVLFTLTPLQDSVLLLYIGGVILPSALELVGGWALYKLYHTRWWDYSDFPFNIGGYICLEFSLLWGVGTLVVMRIVHPVVAGLVDMVPPFVGFVVMCVLYAVYAADVVVTAFAASGLAKTLDAMEQLADSIHAVSDAMTQLLGTTTLNAEALLAQPNSEDYWDMRRDLLRRDLMRHDRRVPVSDSEQTALALQAYQIFADNVLELSLLNLSTGEYRVIKRDPRLPGAGSDAEEDFAAYCERMVTNKVIHPDDAEMFTDQTDLETLRSAVFSTQQPEAYRFRKNVSGQFVWITMEFLPCRNCCAQNPWATVVVREDAQADHLSEELDFSYSHDTLTGLLNRSLFETDLRTLQSSEYDSMVCTYIDVVGLHEINNHLGHRSGDAMLCFIANAARKFFVSSRIYRIGGDEFVILTPNQPPYSVWVAVDKMRAFLRAKEYEISVGIQSTNNLHRLDDAMNQAEAAMRQDKQAYYARNGQERQLRGLNEKLEQTLTEKRDAEHFLRVLAPKYKSVFVVDLKTDRMRGVIVPDYFQKILDTSGGSFLAVLQQYRDTQVQPAYRESLADLLDYNYIRSKVLTGDIVEHTYKKTDDTTFRVKVTPYSRSGSHIDETL